MSQKNLTNQHGDVLLYRIDSLPERVRRIEPTEGRHVLAEGEATGHAHAICDLSNVDVYVDEQPAQTRRVLLAGPLRCRLEPVLRPGNERRLAGVQGEVRALRFQLVGRPGHLFKIVTVVEIPSNSGGLATGETFVDFALATYLSADGPDLDDFGRFKK